MSQRFFRCPHCRLPHDEGETVCPLTGRSIELRRTTPPPVMLPEEDEDESTLLRGLIMPPVPAAAVPQGEAHRPPSAPPRPASVPPPPSVPPSVPPVLSSLPRSDAPPRADATREGEVFGGVYLVKGVIGRGATAIVYEGEHQVLGRPVALKVMTAERVQSPEARRRFLQEAQAAASLAHPNICRIYDLGSLPDGAMYCAMEYLQGEALSTRIEREGALPLVDAVDFAMQMLAGLGAAHRKGIIHRDIKPENVFLAQVPGVARPVVKILDFGLAKQVLLADDGEGGEVTQITRTGVVVGTPFYMAPEAVTGQRDLDARADVWATGVVLYLMATGRLPFRGANWADTAQGILQREPASLTELRPSAPERLVKAVATALAKKREARYASAADFAAALVAVRRETR